MSHFKKKKLQKLLLVSLVCEELDQVDEIVLNKIITSGALFWWHQALRLQEKKMARRYSQWI
jgi:hypothetical protein